MYLDSTGHAWYHWAIGGGLSSTSRLIGESIFKTTTTLKKG